MRCALVFSALVIVMLGATPARAVDASLQWVEVEVALSPDGKAMVKYHIRWQVSRGDMGGFYFQGEQGSIRWHRPGCGAVTTSGVRLCHAVTIAPIAFPNPGPVCKLTNAACLVPWAYPSAIPSALASCNPKT